MSNGLVELIATTLLTTTPILLAALAGAICLQAGIVHIGLEGVMLAGAFGAVIGSYNWGGSGAGLALAVALAVAISVLFALFVVTLQTNQVVAGLGLNLLAVGLAGYILPVIYNTEGQFSPPGLHGLPHVTLPVIGGLGVLGPMLSGHDPLTYLSWLLIPLTWLFLYRTTVGTHLRAAGEAEEAARAAGLHVQGLRYLALIIAGVLAGLAGAQLSLGQVTLFNKAMTGGRGFIALAAFYFGAARPVPTAIASFIFGFFEALQYRLQIANVPPQWAEMAPYLAVVAVLTAVALRRRALGRA